MQAGACSARRSTGSCPRFCPTTALVGQRPAGDVDEPGDHRRDGRRRRHRACLTSTASLGWAALLLAVRLGARLAAALGIPRVPVARAEGGWRRPSARLVGHAADRILRLAIMGQVFVWSIASLVPPPVLAYAKGTWTCRRAIDGVADGGDRHRHRGGLLRGGPAVGVQGRIRPGSPGGAGTDDHDTGLRPDRPGLAGTMLLMALMGFSAGLVFVPLNALHPVAGTGRRRGAGDRAGATCSSTAACSRGRSWRWATAPGRHLGGGRFSVPRAVLAVGTLWALWLVPDAFLRFVLIMLADTLYGLRVMGRANVSEQGPRTVDAEPRLVRRRPVRDRHDRPADPVRRLCRVFQAAVPGPVPPHHGGDPDCRPWRPQDDSARPFARPAGIDNGELVCIFPEGQITRTGMTLPFQRGLERIVKGRDVPIIPVHIDRATSSVFSPMRKSRLPERAFRCR